MVFRDSKKCEWYIWWENIWINISRLESINFQAKYFVKLCSPSRTFYYVKSSFEWLHVFIIQCFWFLLLNLILRLINLEIFAKIWTVRALKKDPQKKFFQRACVIKRQSKIVNKQFRHKNLFKKHKYVSPKVPNIEVFGIVLTASYSS